jgi:glutamate dehydrogenase/leucine dehydrogenase
MNNILPKNNLSAKLLPKSQDSNRFSKSYEDSQEANYEVIETETNKVWGYVSIDNTKRGPGLGGIRLVQNISENEIKRLARVMTLKNSAACLPYGGGKSGLLLNEQISNIDPILKKDLMRMFAEALFDLKNYVPAADMGTDENDIQTIYEHHAKILQKTIHDRGGAGRPVEYGGIPIDEWELTAHGLYAAAQTLENLLDDFKLKDSKVIIQGFGNVGCPIALKLVQKGAVIIGASDINSALWNPKGLDINELCRIRKLNGGLSLYSKSVEKTFGPEKLDWLLEAPCDILIPAARPDAITSKNIDRIDCRIILQGANSPSSKPVEHYLTHRRNILSLTDFIVNAGGVIGCAVERRMSKSTAYGNKVKANGTRIYTEKLIFDTISKNMQEIFKRMKENYIFRDVATDLAYERINSQEIWL